MKNFRTPRKKFKKKIAELLATVLREEEAFAAAFAPILRRKFTRQTEAARRSDEIESTAKKETEFFAPDTAEFAAAMRKLSPDLLKLLDDQFNVSPKNLLRGAFHDTSKQTEQISTASFEEDEDYD